MASLPEQYQGKNRSLRNFWATEKIYNSLVILAMFFLSLRQHLVRQPQYCYWVKVETIERPSRKILEEIEQAWIAENGSLPIGNGENKDKWVSPIDAKALITPEEQANYDNPVNDEMAKMKIIKNVARRVEADILKELEARGLQMQVRFNPKLKEEGLLDVKS